MTAHSDEQNVCASHISASRRRLEGLEVIHGYAVGSARVFVNDSIEVRHERIIRSY
jgi:hypothetical protein